MTRLCPNILKQDFAKDSLYTVLSDEYGLVPVKANNSFEARLADADEREDLLLPQPSAVLVMRQTSYLKNSRPVEYTRSVYKGNQRFESIHGSLVSSQQDV